MEHLYKKYNLACFLSLLNLYENNCVNFTCTFVTKIILHWHSTTIPDFGGPNN